MDFGRYPPMSQLKAYALMCLVSNDVPQALRLYSFAGDSRAALLIIQHTPLPYKHEVVELAIVSGLLVFRRSFMDAVSRQVIKNRRIITAVLDRMTRVFSGDFDTVNYGVGVFPVFGSRRIETAEAVSNARRSIKYAVSAGLYEPDVPEFLMLPPDIAGYVLESLAFTAGSRQISDSIRPGIRMDTLGLLISIVSDKQKIAILESTIDNIEDTESLEFLVSKFPNVPVPMRVLRKVRDRDPRIYEMIRRVHRSKSILRLI